jgi:hypothetical protein
MSHLDSPEAFGAHVASAEPQTFGAFLDTVIAWLGVITITPENKQKIKDAIKSAYDVFCVKVDIPYLPERFEVLVEAYMWTVIEKAVDELLAKAK